MGPFGGWTPHISSQKRALMGGRKCPVRRNEMDALTGICMVGWRKLWVGSQDLGVSAGSAPGLLWVLE